MTDREKIIALVDNDRIKPSDAIIVLEGDGTNRCAQAITLYRAGMASKIVFSGNTDDPTYGSFPLSKIRPIFESNDIPTDDIIHENISTNTREQADEVIKMADRNSWTKIILVASHYHQYRAYLTFLKSVSNSGKNLIIYNAPARELEWFSETGWGKRIELLEQEFIKIEKYSKSGHLAGLDEAIKYQAWKETLQ